MRGGRLEIQGSAKSCLGGCMQNGYILVTENVGRHVGQMMEGGRIKILGNAGQYVGLRMEEGQIHILGEYHSLALIIEGGEIFHRGRQIWPKN